MTTNYLVNLKNADLFGEKQVIIKGVTKIEFVKKSCLMVRFKLENGLPMYYKASGIESIEIYEA
jgi:hypothetical protein